MKKIFIVLVVVLAIAGIMALVGCGGEKEPETVTLTYWDFKYEEEVSGAAFREMDAMFMEQNPNIIINHVAQAEENLYATMMAAFASQADVDVVLTHADNRGWSIADSFTVLDDYIGDVKSDYATASLAACSSTGSVDENVKMLPLTTQGFGIYYNKTNFEKAGLDPESVPLTLAEFEAACEALKAAGIPPIMLGNQGKAFGVSFLYRVLLATYYGDDLNGFADGTENFTDPEFVEASRIIKSFYDNDYVNIENPSIPYFMDAINNFKNGDGGFFIGLTSDIAHWKDFGDAFGYENVGYFSSFQAPDAKYPDAQVVQGAGIALASVSYSDNVEEAVEFMKAYTSGSIGEVFMSRSGAIVPNSTIPVDSSNTVLSAILDKMAVNGVPDFTAKIPAPMLEDHYSLISLFFLADEISLDEYIERSQKQYEANF